VLTKKIIYLFVLMFVASSGKLINIQSLRSKKKNDMRNENDTANHNNLVEGEKEEKILLKSSV